jgi:ankyrin repeat protein
MNKLFSLLILVTLSSLQLCSMEEQPPNVCDLPKGPIFDLKLLTTLDLIARTETAILHASLPDEVREYVLKWKKIISVNGLLEAAQLGDEKRVKFILKHGQRYGITVNSQNLVGDAPLMIAVSHNDISLASILLKKGADVNTHNSNGSNPLKKASRARNADLINLLVEFNADLTSINKGERMAALIDTELAGYAACAHKLQNADDLCNEGEKFIAMSADQHQAIVKLVSSQDLTAQEWELFS